MTILKYKLYVVVLTVLLKRTTAENPEVAEPCGNGTYYPTYEICCGGRVTNSNSGTFTCCGDDVQTVDDESQICCDGKLYAEVDSESECCGDELYDRRKYWRCCTSKYSTNHSLISVDDQHMSCCCSLSYVPSDNIYCNIDHCLVQNVGYGICNDTEYYKGNNSCCAERLIEGIPEDYQTYKCCGKEIHKKEESGTCCGLTFAYSGLDCCGTDAVFNSTTQRCCKETVLNITTEWENCCGDQLYNTETQVCCGQDVYDKDEKQCCGGTKLASKSLTCCGEESFNNKTHICCDKRDSLVIVEKAKSWHNTCCSEDNELKSCDNIPSKCGHETFDQERDLCCRYKLFRCAKQRGYICCTSKSEALVQPTASTDAPCIVYNESDTCERIVSTKAQFPKKNTSLLDYNICRTCIGEWNAADALKALEDGRVDACKATALKMRIMKRVKKRKKGQKDGESFTVKYRMTLLHLNVEENIFNPSDKALIGYRLRAYVPCRCSQWKRDDRIVLVTSAKLGKLIRLGDSDVVIPYTVEIANELRWKKLLCP